MAQILWQPCPATNTCIMSKAAQLLRTHTIFSSLLLLSMVWAPSNSSWTPVQVQNVDVEALILQNSAHFLKDNLRAWDLTILASPPKNGHPCSETRHSPTEDVLWVLSPKITTQWCHEVWIFTSPICKVEYDDPITMGWYDLTCISSCLNKKVLVLWVMYPQKQAMDLVHRKCFEKKKWVRTMNRWLVPFKSFATFQCTGKPGSPLRNKELSQSSQLHLGTRPASAAECPPATTKLTQGARLQSKFNQLA